MPLLDDSTHFYPVWTVAVHWTTSCSGDVLGAPAPGAWLDVRCRRWVQPRPLSLPLPVIGWPVLAREAAA